jgi:hypothetical protein
MFTKQKVLKIMNEEIANAELKEKNKEIFEQEHDYLWGDIAELLWDVKLRIEKEI